MESNCGSGNRDGDSHPCGIRGDKFSRQLQAGTDSSIPDQPQGSTDTRIGIRERHSKSSRSSKTIRNFIDLIQFPGESRLHRKVFALES